MLVVATMSTKDVENENLAWKYRPLLVLYPEIEKGSKRDDHHDPDYRMGRPHLKRDYHPRDINLVLEYARLPGKRGKPSREQLLDFMDKNWDRKNKAHTESHIDLIDRGGPKEVSKFWNTYASIPDRDSAPNYKKKAYARLVRGNGWFKDYVSIQYWLAYFFDDWANVHEMDWEMVSVIVKKTDVIEKPVACVFNAHSGGFRMPWEKVDKVDDNENKDGNGLHPVAYVASGSHASYFSDYPPHIRVASHCVGPMLSKILRITKIGKDFIDHVPTFEEGAKHFPEIELIPEPYKPEPDKEGRWSGDWRWLNFKGYWGSRIQLSHSERLIALVPGLREIKRFFKRPLREAGPPGPSAKGLCWEKPFYWANLECEDAKKTIPWLEQI